MLLYIHRTIRLIRDGGKGGGGGGGRWEGGSVWGVVGYLMNGSSLRPVL